MKKNVLKSLGIASALMIAALSGCSTAAPANETVVASDNLPVTDDSAISSSTMEAATANESEADEIRIQHAFG